MSSVHGLSLNQLSSLLRKDNVPEHIIKAFEGKYNHRFHHENIQV
jgi:hypothetical protein